MSTPSGERDILFVFSHVLMQVKNVAATDKRYFQILDKTFLDVFQNIDFLHMLLECVVMDTLDCK